MRGINLSYFTFSGCFSQSIKAFIHSRGCDEKAWLVLPENDLSKNFSPVFKTKIINPVFSKKEEFR